MTQPPARGPMRGVTSYGDVGFSRFLRGAFLAGAGFDADDLDRPLIGIADLASDYNPCHRAVPEIIAHVKRGVLQGGGLPMVFPTMSLGETFLTPTSMLFRNLLAMETEELIRAQPMDAVVLVGGCDKTVPAQLMAAANSDVPALVEVVGPMITNTYEGQRLGACTDCRRMWARHRSGELDTEQIGRVEGALATTSGTCMVMGTASTMACMAETLGMMLPGGATPPSPTGDRLRHAVATGRRAAELAREPVVPREVMTRPAFLNALTVLGAVGGSTNAVVHLLAIARRAGVELTLRDFDEVSRRVPLLLDLKPSGQGYMEDFHRAGGLPTLLRALAGLLDTGHVGVAGRSLGELLADVHPPAGWQTTIRTLDQPLGEVGALAVLTGTLAPEGAVIKASAATASLLRHTGPALVFESPEDAAERLDSPDLDVTADHVLVLRGSGPVGAGMPEAGSLPIPRKLASAGVTDMVRVSDARMSGTSYGTVVLHCTPESAVGGPLALVRDGDLISVDVPGRRIDLLVDEDELSRRRSLLSPWPVPERGWRRLYAETVLSASQGADLRFM
ncbi:dihydroxy-acid dehydratase [Geodermatophilus sp. DSM 44513]|uniref:dihydroxy-acid dehydratase n=1 Tax=Geodermatophilus sp. DSM 44513 TaxID=1528104 RepID=UPI001412BE58|nr:dihydroxy-acid dehydratase [Geodermatophilus sp. DSM 44513]WNV75078.1 dihydroxy-acid dehydratase [Geodermatophilus sp. DSM 44513]